MQPVESEISSKRFSVARNKWIGIAISISVFCAVLLYLILAEDEIDVLATTSPPLPQPVSYEQIVVTPETARILSHATIAPKWSTQIKAVVSGRVIKVEQNSLIGTQVDKGAVLLRIEDSKYMAAQKTAEQIVKQAKLKVWHAKNKTKVARGIYRRDGTKPPNALALYLPQLEIAQAELASAEANLAVARQNLSDTVIRAPFSGYITKRLVNPGQIVEEHEKLLELIDDTTFEITAEITHQEWNLLKQPIRGQPAKIIDQNGLLIANATVTHAAGYLDSQTRLHKIFLQIMRAGNAKIFSGNYVSVLIRGISIDKAFNIPSTALTQNGYVWTINSDNMLERHSPKILFRHDHRIVIEPLEQLDSAKIAVAPLASFLPGQIVHPIIRPATPAENGGK